MSDATNNDPMPNVPQPQTMEPVAEPTTTTIATEQASIPASATVTDAEQTAPSNSGTGQPGSVDAASPDIFAEHNAMVQEEYTEFMKKCVAFGADLEALSRHHGFVLGSTQVMVLTDALEFEYDMSRGFLMTHAKGK